MMNILSQLVQSGSKQPSASQEGNVLSENSDKQGMSKKFTQLMMGLLGMGSESDINKEHLLPDEAKTTTESAKRDTSSEQVKLQHQFPGLTGDKVESKQSELAQLIDSHFVSLSQKENSEGETILSVKVNGGGEENEESEKILRLKMTADKAAAEKTTGDKVDGKNNIDIPITSGEVTIEGQQMLNNLLSKSQQSGDTEVGKQSKEANILQQISEHIGALKTDQVLTEINMEKVAENSEKLTQNNQNKFGDNTQKIPRSSENSQENSLGKTPLSLKDFPGMNITADKNGGLGNNQEAKIISQSAKGNVLKHSAALENVLQKLAESVDGEQKNSSNSVKGISQLSNSGEKSSQAPAGEQKHPVLKHLMNQGEEKTAKNAKAKMTTQFSAENTSNNTRQAASGKAAFANVAQNFVSVQPEKTSFKPIQSASPQVALDPSKLMDIEAGNGAELEMELQAQTDKDTSANEDGKTSMRLKNMTIGQLTRSSGRREFSTQLVRQLQQQAEQAKAGSTQNWSHHRFLLDDGEAVNLAVRQGDGAMQLQLGAGNSELNKIIQQHIEEIRQHLQEQLDMNIDLQLQHFGEQEAGEFNEDSPSGTFGNGIDSSAEGTNTEEGASTRTARYFGFNNNEWTA